MQKQKRVAAIHDISGFGKCSLTVALPIISAAGIECAVVPTAVLSTHTGGFEGFTYRDLNDDLRPFMEHWKSLDIHFDAMYTGFLGSVDQIGIIAEFFDNLKSDDTIILVDPVMADNGKLYAIFSEEIISGMASLCRKADVIIPNITEASLMVGYEYREGTQDAAYIEGLIGALLKGLGKRDIILTGVSLENGRLGAAVYDSKENTISYCMGQYIDGYFHGTGDVFGSVALSGLLNGFGIKDAAQLAVDFTVACIRRCAEYATPPRQGVPFERELPGLIKRLGLG